MISRLHLINFRRHIDTELTFSNDAQIVAITGNNGSGKTSILEAITYALYGEARYGRRNLARMVRRGGEHDGMQVEIAFNVGDVEYELVRRHEKGKTSATLMANGNPIMQSPDGVTAEVTKIFGMDSTGYRLAAIAQQFDVDGLTDLTPAKRRQTITRLLRQDAITRAKIAASDEKNRQLGVVNALGEGPDMESLTEELAEVREEMAADATAVAESEAALADLDRELAGASQTREAWQSAQIAAARADATISAARAEADRLSAELDSVFIPAELPVPDVPLARLMAELSEVNIAVSRGESAQQLARVAEQTRAELVSVEESLARIEGSLNGDTPALLAMGAGKITAAVTAAEQALALTRESERALAAERVSPAGELAALRARAEQAAALGAVCNSCEQPISAAHKESQQAAHAARELELVTLLAQLTEAGSQATVDVRAAEEVFAKVRADRDKAAGRRQVVEALVAQRRDLAQRKVTYLERLERLGDVREVDMDALYARKANLDTRRAGAEQYEQVVMARSAALERSARVAQLLQSALARVEEAASLRKAAVPDTDLAAAHARLVASESLRRSEAEMVAAVRLELAKAQEREVSVLKFISAAQAQSARLRDVRAGADRAAKAARLLDVTADRMATQIRPALEGAISDTLNRLSEGRFSAVELTDSYDITVFDDGKYQPLSELSGGERVLVALATRLALAQVVAGRHAAGGVGMLVLDEVFGSQDGERRDAIMSTLRALRSEYGQILLISHVGGLEELADHVIDVSLRVEDGVRIAEVQTS